MLHVPRLKQLPKTVVLQHLADVRTVLKAGNYARGIRTLVLCVHDDDVTVHDWTFARRHTVAANLERPQLLAAGEPVLNVDRRGVGLFVLGWSCSDPAGDFDVDADRKS